MYVVRIKREEFSALEYRWISDVVIRDEVPVAIMTSLEQNAKVFRSLKQAAEALAAYDRSRGELTEMKILRPSSPKLLSWEELPIQLRPEYMPTCVFGWELIHDDREDVPNKIHVHLPDGKVEHWKWHETKWIHDKVTNEKP